MAKKAISIDSTTPDERVHGGHRSRMKEKMMHFGDGIFDPHELLEMLLYHVIPMRDTNPIAHRLLATFGSLEGVFSAEKEELLKVEGVKEKTAEMLLSVGRFGDIPFFSKQNATKYDSHTFLGRYFVDVFGDITEKQTYILMLTNSLELIAIEKVCDGDLYCALRHTKELLVKILKRGASIVVLAHNHPNGPLYETPDDFDAMHNLKKTFMNVGIVYLENYIVCGSHFISTMGKIDCMTFYQTPEIEQFLREKETMPNALVAMRP